MNDATGVTVIVVVDDNVDLADGLADLLQMSGYRTWTAYDGRAAVRLVEDEAPDVVISDIEMPDMTGLQAAVLIRALPLIKQPWMVAVTGKSGFAIEIDALAAGFDHFMRKPTCIPELLRLIEGFSKGRALTASSSRR